jgi:hypothetical protein
MRDDALLRPAKKVRDDLIDADDSAVPERVIPGGCVESLRSEVAEDSDPRDDLRF